MPNLDSCKVILIVLIFIGSYSCKDDGYRDIKSKDLSSAENVFVGSNACASCHAQEFEAWQN